MAILSVTSTLTSSLSFTMAAMDIDNNDNKNDNHDDGNEINLVALAKANGALTVEGFIKATNGKLDANKKGLVVCFYFYFFMIIFSDIFYIFLLTNHLK